MENKELQHWKDQCLHFQHAWEKTQVLLNNLREEHNDLILELKQKDAAIQILQDIIDDNRSKALNELTKQAQELNMGY
jgi:Mg/Co/Ni transporter MgtE